MQLQLEFRLEWSIKGVEFPQKRMTIDVQLNLEQNTRGGERSGHSEKIKWSARIWSTSHTS